MGALWIRKLSALAAVAVVGVTGASVAAQAAPTTLNWGPVSTSQVPPTREFGAMTFDSTRNRTILWGGGNSAFVNLNDTWEFDGTSWLQRTPSTSPPALVGSAMAFDANRHVSVMFGGSGFPGNSAATWEWDGTNWTLRTFATSPAARFWTTMAYDSARGKIVLFGGDGASSTEFGDTWEYDGLTWTHMTPANSPTPRFGAAMAYDPGLGRVVLFGGRVSGQRMADTWEWDGNNWTQFTPAATPFPRFWHTMAFDPQVGHVVIFGGDHIEPFGLGPINDTWEWDGSQWTQDWTSATPSARAGHTMALDANGRVVMLGGSDEGNPGVFPTDTEELGTGIVTPAGNPSIALPASLNFGNVDVGVTSSATYIQLFNTGTGPLVATISATGDFAISSTYCPSAPNPLAAGMLCRAFITFTPTAAGDRVGSFVVTGNVPGGSQSVALHGFGVCCDFTISASPTNTGTVQGTSITAAISTTVVGTPATVALSFLSTDPGLTATFSPSSITAGGGSTMTITVGPAVPVGLQGIEAVGTEGPVSHMVEVFVNVRAALTSDFSIAANPSTLTVVEGQSGTSTVNTALVTGTAGTINLSVTFSSNGLAPTLNPVAVTAGGSSTLTVSPSLALPPGTYTVTVTGTEGSATHSASVTVIVPPPPPNDFSISASPTTVTVLQGAGTSSAISTAVTSGSAEMVSLSASSPAGLTATLSPTAVTAGGGSTLTVTASAAVAPGAYTVTVTGASISSTHSVAVTVNVTAALSDFAISVSPSSLTILQGNNATSTITTTLVSGTPDAISLRATSSPIGVGSYLSPFVVNAGATSTMTISVFGLTTPGVYTLTVTGTEGAVTHSTSVTVTVTLAPSDFVIRVAPTSLTIVQGNSGTIDIGTTAVTGTADAINLSAVSSPSGLITSLNPTVVNAGGTSTLTISVGATIAPGTYTVTVTGVEGFAMHSTTVTVTVTAAPSDFAISASPSSVTIVQQTSGTATISTTLVTGTADAISLSAVLSPLASDLSPSLNPAVVTAGAGSTLTISVDALAIPGVYTVVVTGSEGSAVHSTTVTVTVTATPPDFAISSSPSSLTVVQGNSGTSTISTAITAGMTAQAISLSESSSPVGLATGLSPAVITSGGASTLLVSPDFTTVPGTYVVTVTGTEASGAIHSTSVTVTVAAGPRDFTISANPSALSIVQGSITTSSISTAVIGGPGTIVLSNSAPAGGLSATLLPTSISAGGSSTLTIGAAYTTAPGTYTVTVTGTEGSNTHSTVISVTVTIKGIVNGGFETGDFAGWATTGVTAIVSTSHSGAFAAQVGSTSPSADSTVSQTFTVPTAGGKLTFWYRMSCSDKVKNDWFTATLSDGVTVSTFTIQPPVCSETSTWTKVTTNLAMFAGHSVTVTFVNHDDGQAGTPTYTLVDDLALI